MRALLFFVLLAATACGTAREDKTVQVTAPAPPDGESAESKDRPKDAETQLVLGIDGEDFAASGYRLTDLRIVVKVDGAVAADVKKPASAGPLFPHELTIAAPVAKLDAPVEVEIRAVMNDADVTKRLVRTHFVPGAKKLAYASLEVRCHNFSLLGGGLPEGPKCTAPETCIGAVCRSSEMGELPDYTADWAKNPPSACGNGPSADLLVGEGFTGFAPLAEGATVTLERGPQCGHHLWISLDMKDLSQWKTVTVLSATQPGSSITVPATAFPYAYTQTSGGRCGLPGIRFQVDIGTAQLADFLGKPLDIKVEATDATGRKATVTRHVNVSPTFSNPTGRPCG